MRWLRTTLTLLAFGVGINAIAAWIIAAQESPRHITIASLSMVTRQRAPDGAWRGPRPWPGAPDPIVVSEHEGFGLGLTVSLAPDVTTPGAFDPSAPQDWPTWTRLFDVRAGWPLYAFEGRRIEHGLPAAYALDHDRDARPVDMNVVHAAALPGPGPAVTTFPLRPLWPGFLVNTLVFAGAAFALAQVGAVLHAFRPRRSGDGRGARRMQ